jgi:hypothetical protein
MSDVKEQSFMIKVDLTAIEIMSIEDGVLNTNELNRLNSTLNNVGLSCIKANDYGFYKLVFFDRQFAPSISKLCSAMHPMLAYQPLMG